MKPRSDCRGFTLIEILVVLVVIGILMGVLLRQFLPYLERSEEYRTISILEQVKTSLQLFEQEMGDYPPSDFHGMDSGSPNPINQGTESMVAALFSPSYTSRRPDEKWLVNTDDDESDKSLTDLGSKALYEIKDAWGNPLVYIHNRDYDKKMTYRIMDPDTGEWIDEEVSAVRVSKERGGDRFWNAQDYQLFSAGADGMFGTVDDLTNWE